MDYHISLRALAHQKEQFKLNHRSIYIFPTWTGIFFGLGAFVLILIAVNEKNIIMLLLSSLCLSVFFLTLVMTYRNLSGLELHSLCVQPPESQRPVFVGEQALFFMSLKAASPTRQHHQILIGLHDQPQQWVELTKGANLRLNFEEEARQRGLLRASKVRIKTVYPLGLWQAWSQLPLAMTCWVFPRPIPYKMPATKHTAFDSNMQALDSARQAGVDDFAGLRAYQPGDSFRRVAWQSLAKGQGLKTKHFVQENTTAILLHWEQFIAANADEAAVELGLSRLCFVILQGMKQGQAIGLKLPHQAFPPNSGAQHQRQLLEALALWPSV